MVLSFVIKGRPSPSDALRLGVQKIVCALGESFPAITQYYQLRSGRWIAATSFNYPMFNIRVSVEHLARVDYIGALLPYLHCAEHRKASIDLIFYRIL